MRTLKNSPLLNIIGFQIGWFSCVLGAAHQMPWLGVMVAIPLLGWHFHKAETMRSEVALIVIATLLGSLFDQALLSSGLIQFTPSAWPAYLLPVWMVTLWALFASTLNIGLRWMRGRYVIAGLFGLVGGPLAYISGARLGAMQLIEPTVLLTALAIGWGIFMPALSWLSTRLDGYTQMRGGIKVGIA